MEWFADGFFEELGNVHRRGVLKRADDGLPIVLSGKIKHQLIDKL